MDISDDASAPASSARCSRSRPTDDAPAIEEQLTTLEHKLMVAMGYVEPPESQEGQDDYLLKTTYQLAAAMAAVDGHIDQTEVQAAEAIGARIRGTPTPARTDRVFIFMTGSFLGSSSTPSNPQRKREPLAGSLSSWTLVVGPRSDTRIPPTAGSHPTNRPTLCPQSRAPGPPR